MSANLKNGINCRDDGHLYFGNHDVADDDAADDASADDVDDYDVGF